jgi:HSP20 family molecular chaperone IbpA
MSATITKSLILSQPKIGQNSDVALPNLPHTTSQERSHTVIKVEIPGIDPSTVEVNCDNNTLHVSCDKGAVILPLPSTSDVTKIEAAILWGMLTIRVPVTEPPAARTIKVSVLDTVPTKKPAAKLTATE